MCGINGIVYPERLGKRVDRETLVEMRDILRHRGPDEAGLFLNINVGLGHRRLSIVDLKSGQQPMYSADRCSVLVYNGEIYNHKEQRQVLNDKGHKFVTESDTETILHLYEEFGPDCVHRLRGMFAFAIWDETKKELFLARDRLGVKPLYYFIDQDGAIFFASEMKALFSTRSIEPKLNFAALPDYLANHGTSGNETLFEGIRRLPPGHTMTWKNGEIRVHQYWDLDFTKKEILHNGAEIRLIDEWHELFKRAVEMRLMSDVPLGMFLSGGIDSGAIAGLMSQLVKDPIKTFSVAFQDKDANELRYARLVADTFGTDHHEIIVSPDQFFANLPRLIWHEDEPIAHPSSVALNFVSRLAASHVKVVLTGEGSDESLAGYGRYGKTLQNLAYGAVYEKFSTAGFRQSIANGILKFSDKPGVRRKLRKSFLALEPCIDSMYFDNFAVFPRHMQADMFSNDTRTKIGSRKDPYFEMSHIFESVPDGSLLDKMLYTDTKTYLHELLMKQDQMSMAASIESRVPFLDHELLEFSARLPDSMKIRGSQTKFVLRRAMKGVLPGEILTRTKMGFPVPVGKWLRGEFRHLVDEFVLSERTSQRGIFDYDFVKELATRHFAGENHDERIWALVNFEMWYRQFIDGETVDIEPRQLELAN